MRKVYVLVVVATIICGSSTIAVAQDDKSKATPTVSEKVEDFEKYDGYFDFYYDEKGGKIWLAVDKFDAEFLYVNSLSAGVGSNDIGLDRGQLGDTRVVKFMRSGPKILLVQPNYSYRAESDNADERASVEQAFAQSVLWGFKVAAEEDGTVLIDLTPMLLSDAHGVADRLKSRKQGTYKLDGDRSAVYLPMTKNFPKNSEFEAMVTFKGDPQGSYIRSVTPTAAIVTVRMHHSFVELPDDEYKPRAFDPRCGYFPVTFYDYATPIQQPLAKRLIRRHRLQKKDPSAERSEPVEPIVYYVDRGAPEPVKSALIEGASWWNQAFEAAGYENAFIVKELPADADPMDVRYNLIQWVHRSTRGWSYGASVYDPRTGEIIKGHVSLGSLRVRQDFLIAQGLLQPYENGTEADPRLLSMALARLRQLSAHEVGHTLGLAHNFAASVNDRASVMDYPHPYISLTDNGEMNFTEAYDTGIGEWDKRTITYGYQDFPEGVEEEVALRNILQDNIDAGLHYISDQDARPQGGAHPFAHLWDNGASATAELNRIVEVRATALENFSEDNIPEGMPMASLENVLVPLYLAHRYQVEAAVKLIGGVNYTYAVRGDQQTTNEPLETQVQRAALTAVLRTLDPEFLAVPAHITDLIPPQPIGYQRDRELFKIHTGLIFDPLAAAESSANQTLTLLMNQNRMARIVEQYARGKSDMQLSELLEMVAERVAVDNKQTAYEQEISRVTEKLFLQHLFHLAKADGMQQVNAVALQTIKELAAKWEEAFSNDDNQQAHYTYLLNKIAQFNRNPEEFELPSPPDLPDGSPIGCGE